MQKNYIELKQRRSFGVIIEDYFSFLKQNLKNFTSIFLAYNGIFILLLLGTSYLLVTGVLGTINHSSGFNSGGATESEFLVYIGAGVVALFLIIILVAALNYSLASAYMIIYENNNGLVQDRKVVWTMVSNRLGQIIIFIMLLFLIYIIFGIASLIFAFIPIIGMIIQYILGFAVSAWLGISFMILLAENASPVDAFSKGMELITGNFWKSVGVNFILGLLVSILVLMVLLIPGFIVGIYQYHALDSGINFTESAFAKIIYTLGTCVVLVLISILKWNLILYASRRKI